MPRLGRALLCLLLLGLVVIVTSLQNQRRKEQQVNVTFVDHDPGRPASATTP